MYQSGKEGGQRAEVSWWQGLWDTSFKVPPIKVSLCHREETEKL